MFKINLSTRQKNGFIIGIVNTLVVILVCILFTIFYYYSGLNQIRKELLTEANEIVTTHIIFSENRIQFKEVDKINTIQNDLLTDGLSAIIYNKEKEIIGRFGIFDFNEKLLSNNESVLSVVNNTFKSNDYSYSTEIDLYGKNSYESLAYPLQNNNETVGVLLLYAPINFFQQLVKISFYILAAVLPISILINFVLGQIISKYAYSPITKLIKKMNSINIHNINEKVQPEGNPIDESYQLASKYNDMLERVNEGVEKQKQFISNASHELKSPIARAISTLDVVKTDIERTDINESIKNNIGEVRNELMELGDMINTLLILSRVKEANNKEKEFNVRDEFLKIREKFKNDDIFIEVDSSINILFNLEYFRSILNNVVENAIKYGTHGSIQIIGLVKDNVFEISVINKVKQSVEMDNETLFNRFSNNSKNGFGLGLSIVKGIVEQENLKLEVFSKNNTFKIVIGGFRIIKK